MHKTETQSYLAKTYNLPQKYILCVSRWDPHKNIIGLLNAYAVYRKKVEEPLDLVFVGGRHMPDYSNEVDAHIISLNLETRVHVAPFIPTVDMPKMYQAAEFMIFPSLYEGFGLPVIEAMACGCPTVLSNIDPLVEVGGDAALFFDPNNSQEMANDMAMVQCNKQLRNTLVEHGFKQAKMFTWEKSTATLINIFKSVL